MISTNCVQECTTLHRWLRVKWTVTVGEGGEAE